MIVQISKYDLINLILGENSRDKINQQTLFKIKTKYNKVIDTVSINGDTTLHFDKDELEKLQQKELLDIYNNYLGGSIIQIQ